MSKAKFGDVKYVDVFAGDVVARRIPDFFRDARLEECPEAARPQIEKWINDPGPGLWLWGQSTCGKTHAACAVTLELLRRGMDGLGVTGLDLAPALIDLRMGALCEKAESLGLTPKGEYSPKPVIEGLMKPAVLLLDDLSLLFWLWPLASDLRPVFEARVAAGKPTIVTSNLDMGDYIRFCDSEAAGYLSNFRCLKFPPGAPMPAEMITRMCKDLIEKWEWMVKLGWLPKSSVGELNARIERIKQEQGTARGSAVNVSSGTLRLAALAEAQAPSLGCSKLLAPFRAS